MTRARNIAVLIVVIFAVYAVLSSPEQSAGVVRNAGDQLASGVRSVGSFFNALLRG